jgi:Prokaryotic N-terminal methylation motif
MKQRPGITLVEVLVAIFIMGIGMIALLTLFPLGAVNIARALQDDRTSQAANNASTVGNAWDVRHDANVLAQFNAQAAAANVLQLNGPSSPVYVDPNGRLEGLGPLGGVIGRVGPRYTELPAGSGNINRPLADAYFSLLDDLNFKNDGTPDTSAVGEVQRYGRYTWAYLLRRPRLGDPRLVEMTVVVYNNRPPQNLNDEITWPAIGTIGQTTLTISYTAGNKPKIRKGNWLLDVTVDTGVTRGYFYRVIDLSEDSTDTQMTLELQFPLRAPTNVVNTNFNFVVMDNVAEVFDRGTGILP